jgi:hypothetical protein
MTCDLEVGYDGGSKAAKGSEPNFAILRKLGHLDRLSGTNGDASGRGTVKCVDIVAG